MEKVKYSDLREGDLLRYNGSSPCLKKDKEYPVIRSVKGEFLVMCETPDGDAQFHFLDAEVSFEQEDDVMRGWERVVAG